MLLRVLSTTEIRKAQELLGEIQRQPGLFILSGPAVANTNVVTASEFLADGWSNESVSHVVRAARTKEANNRKERAEHALCSYIQDKMATFDIFPATVHELEEDKNPTEKMEPDNDQDKETEESLSASLQIRRQITRIHENMTVVVRVKHRKRPAGPIVSCSPNSFVFNDVVGLDLFFLNTHEKHAHLP